MRVNLLTHRFILSLSVIFMCILLSACSQSTKIKTDLAAYQQRLEDFTGLPLQNEIKVDKDFSLDLAKKAELRKDVEAVNINLREFYAFNDCTLNQLVAQRNTALGKMQLPSSRYLYELDLLNELTRCKHLLMQQESKQDLVEKLLKWKQIKEQQLPNVWSNLITQSEEIYSHLTRNVDYISGSSADNFQASKQAWLFLTQIGQFETFTLNSKDLEYHLQQLADSPFLARKWKTQSLLAGKLNHINPILEQYLSINTCKTPKEEADIAIMRNIFTMFFVNKIQPLGSELNKYHYQLNPIIQDLIDNQHLPKQLKSFLEEHENKSFRHYQQSMQTHIKLWQKIFARCN